MTLHFPYISYIFLSMNSQEDARLRKREGVGTSYDFEFMGFTHGSVKKKTTNWRNFRGMRA
ncbi:MAG: hypothetical protein K9M99_12925 [Candidatus Cloacimonetes bacterium]|nr:hypothetical protein [Candidatus Cloacimonadota bacterium]